MPTRKKPQEPTCAFEETDLLMFGVRREKDGSWIGLCSPVMGPVRLSSTQPQTAMRELKERVKELLQEMLSECN